MNNKKVLVKRWREVDKKLSTFYSINKKLSNSLLVELQQIVDSINFKYENANDYAQDKQLKALKNNIRNVDKLEGYAGFILKDVLRKSKIKNNELLNAYILLAYYKRNLKQLKEENALFDEIISIGYNDGFNETAQILEIEKRKIKIKKRDRKGILAGALSVNGVSWYGYKQSLVVYNSSKYYQSVLVQLAHDEEMDVYYGILRNEFDKQERAYLNIKEEDKKKDQNSYWTVFYGALDAQVVYFMNQSFIKGIEDAPEIINAYYIKNGRKKYVPITMVQFIAVMDSKTTDMCSSLNGQIFDINGINKFKRYSSAYGGIVQYEVKGLELGINLPPITDHIHHCRSTIIPYIGKDLTRNK